MKLIADSTTINFADSNMSDSLDIRVLLIQEYFGRKQLSFSKDDIHVVLSQPTHFPAPKVCQLYDR